MVFLNLLITFSYSFTVNRTVTFLVLFSFFISNARCRYYLKNPPAIPRSEFRVKGKMPRLSDKRTSC